MIATGDLHDFDFLCGTWKVVNLRLRARFTDKPIWDEFPATSHCEPRLGGIVNIDEFVFPEQGFSAVAVRVFDLAKRQWAIYWIDSRNGILLPPVHGGFTGECGQFYGDDLDDGQPVRVRFLWTRLGPDRARWEQAFSRASGVWETNWIMEFRRA